MKRFILVVFVGFSVSVLGQNPSREISSHDTIVVEVMNLKREVENARNEFEKYRGISNEADNLINETYRKIEEEAAKEHVLSDNFSSVTEFVLFRNLEISDKRPPFISKNCSDGFINQNRLQFNSFHTVRQQKLRGCKYPLFPTELK